MVIKARKGSMVMFVQAQKAHVLPNDPPS